MATIVNSMDKRISNTRVHTNYQAILIKSLFAGTAGYLIFLATMALTYWFTYKLFRLGSTHVDNFDLLISTFGFFTLFAYFFIKGTKQENSKR